MEIYSDSHTSQSQLTNTPVKSQVVSRTSQVSPWLTPLAYFLGRNLVLPLFFGNINIIGIENIPTNGPIILAPTHRSRWDSLLLPYATGRCVTGRDMRFMVTSSECQGLQGWFVLRMGGFPVDTQSPAIATLRHAVELMAEGEMLVIFPEGGIYRDHKVQTLKSGTARLALSAESLHPGLGVKIIPVGINYSQPYPNWGTDVNLHIGEPIQVTDYMNGNLKKGAKHLTTDLTNKLQQLTYQQSEISSRNFAEITNS
ncbi:1-acyl-sn-glycerol-3-phosphate acyltransferase [Anabaena sp. PCC 7108]|uniref:lysophospholipid acyltransferase family protein n=1 Tax=Anabaena sp. PCC 7108 TaxID=163908 RepID=UPI000361A307|nr:1-acyl-sn-glycerol-3-phosphate acyltransferase [Anabaena sp. PCC 7108]